MVDRVSKRFKKHTVVKKSYTTIKTGVLAKLFRRRYPRDNYVEALQEISVDIPPGSSLGLIGSNGSGKSTLLKLIAGIYRPDSGHVRVTGRVSALIELGAGFHPDFTGRENLYLGGVMYGLSKRQIEQRMDQIISYAELADFIDDPVRTYSSGMYMRLGFSLAVHTDPDILLVDEVLAVGDAGFVSRCHDTISEFKRRGKTLIFVTHDLDAVTRWCDEAIWLEKGFVRERGEPKYVVDRYLQEVRQAEERHLEQENAADAERHARSSADSAAADASELREEGKRWGNGDVTLTGVHLYSEAGDARWVFGNEEPMTIEVRYRIERPVEDLVFGVGILRVDGLTIHGVNTDIDDVRVPVPEKPQNGAFTPVEGIYRFKIRRLDLTEGSYYVDVAAHRRDGLPYDYHHRSYKFSVRTETKPHGVYNPQHEWEIVADYAPASAEPLPRMASRAAR